MELNLCREIRWPPSACQSLISTRTWGQLRWASQSRGSYGRVISSLSCPTSALLSLPLLQSVLSIFRVWLVLVVLIVDGPTETLSRRKCPHQSELSVTRTFAVLIDRVLELNCLAVPPSPKSNLGTVCGTAVSCMGCRGCSAWVYRGCSEKRSGCSFV